MHEALPAWLPRHVGLQLQLEGLGRPARGGSLGETGRGVAWYGVSGGGQGKAGQVRVGQNKGCGPFDEERGIGAYSR